MFIRKISAVAGAAAVVASGLALSVPGVAHADPALNSSSQFNLPAAKDLVGVGSDTTQLLMGALGAYYNAHVVGTSADQGSGALLTNYDACTLPAGQFYPCASPTAGTSDNTNTTNRILTNVAGAAAYIDRPNGSGQGRAALGSGGTANDRPGVAFGRSSGALDAAGVTAHLEAYPYAVDTLEMVTSAGSTPTHLPSSLALADIQGIYNGTYKTIGSLPGNSASPFASETIHAYFPQSGSGTMQFFMQQLSNGTSKSTGTWSSNGSQCEYQSGVPATCSSTTNANLQVQEHDPSFVKSDPDAIAPFSLGRMTLINGQTANTIAQAGTWSVQRAVYNVLRTVDNSASGTADTSAWFAGTPLMNSVFGPNGFLCSPAAKGTIEAQGFFQLQSQTAANPSGQCGVGITTANAPQNLNINAAGKMTTQVQGTIPTVAFGYDHSVTVHTLAQSGVIPTGTVSFTLAGRAFSGTLDATGSVTIPASKYIYPGTYSGTISYSGDVNFTTTTAPIALTVTKAKTYIVSYPSSAAYTGKAYKVTTIVKVYAGVVRPTKTVGIYKGSTLIGWAYLSNGNATVVISAANVNKYLPKGTRVLLTEKFAGETRFLGSSKSFHVTRH